MACAPRWQDTVRFDICHLLGAGAVLVVTANRNSCSTLCLPALMADSLRCDSSLHAASTGVLGSFLIHFRLKAKFGFFRWGWRHALLQGTNIFYIIRLMSLRGDHPSHSQALLGFWRLKNKVEMKHVSWRLAGRSVWKEKCRLYSNPLCAIKLHKAWAPCIVCIDIILVL